MDGKVTITSIIAMLHEKGKELIDQFLDLFKNNTVSMDEFYRRRSYLAYTLQNTLLNYPIGERDVISLMGYYYKKIGNKTKLNYSQYYSVDFIVARAYPNYPLLQKYLYFNQVKPKITIHYN